MTIKLLVIAAALAGVAIAELAAPRLAAAQSSTSGAIQGTVTDAASGDALAGVTVVISSPVLQGTQTVLSDENGFYKVGELPPGEYKVTFYFNKAVVERSGIAVGVNKTTPVFQAIKEALTGGEVVKITDTAPNIDPTSTTQGITLDKNYLKNIPIPGRTFESALGAAAGSKNDGVGVAFSGSSSLENQYVVDGVNTTGLTFGTVGTPVINDFIEEIEVITGGYNAEYGRSTGGVVNVVTKTGSNELKGSVFMNVKPGVLTAAARPIPRNASSIDAVGNNVYLADIGFDLGGPIIKDRLWYYVGVAPQAARTDITRTTKRQTDCRAVLASGQLSPCDPRLQGTDMGSGFADTKPDIDPKTGFFITDTLDNEIRTDTSQGLNVLGKLNFAATPDNQIQVTLQALPSRASNPGIFGLASTGQKTSGLTTDLSGKWTTKVNDNKTEIEAVVGWHRSHLEVNAYDPSTQNQPLQGLTGGSLGVFGPGFGGETQRTIDGCRDSTVASADAYPYLDNNCPMNDPSYYLVGGPGSLFNDTEQRFTAKAALTQRAKLLGSHEIKGGLDLESNRDSKARLYSGGAFIQNFVGQDVRVTRWVQLSGRDGSNQAMANTDPRFDNQCRTPDHGPSANGAKTATYDCDYLGGTVGDPGTQIEGNTLNWAGYLRDSWQIRPNLTLNAGLRYEEQRMRYASFLQHTSDPLTAELLGKNALTLQNMWAPRVGLIYDWTQEGRSKVYANWGRFFESIPMDINDRSFGGEVSFVQDFTSCGTTDMRIGGSNGVNCLADPTKRGSKEQLVGASGVYIAPGIKPQYLDELVVGAEYEVIDDLKVGLSYQNRRLGRVIEDVSTDGADTYLIANPGEWSAADEKRLTAQIDATSDPDEKARLANKLKLFQGIRTFDKPRRNYDAVTLTVTRRFSKELYLQGSYTYSRARGNYPGLISFENGQIDPNISSQYDLIELLANREGPLPQDTPHSFKLDGYYTFNLKKQGELTVGTRIRASSGSPENALASHYLYGANESYLLPRGSVGRTDFVHAVDLKVEYHRKLGGDQKMVLGVYAQVENVYNNQATSRVDETYAPPVTLGKQLQNANPVSGGSYEDLIWVKQINDKGVEQHTPIGRNPNFGNPTGRLFPAIGSVGAHLDF